MTIIEILNGSEKVIVANLKLLAEDYLDKTGRKVCLSCPSDIQYMLKTLKRYYDMTQFEFKRHAAMYKNRKGDKTTISNGNLTDEKAIEFLKTNPERINLFSEFPSNWKKLIKGETETEAEAEARLAAEAEEAARNSAKNIVIERETEAEKEARLAKEASKPKEEDLLKMSLSGLRLLYPEVKATSIKKFVEKVLAL